MKMNTMDRKSSRAKLAALILPLALTVACSEPPQTQIDAAKTALDQAVAADAAQYAPEALANARARLDALNAEVSAQGEKFALLRSYETTATLAAAAEQAAQEVVTAAAAAKQQAQDGAVAALASAQQAIDEARPLLDLLASCRKKPKGFAADLEALRGNLDGLAGLVPAIEEALAAGEFLSAKSQAEALQQQAESLTADLRSAKERIAC